MERVLISREHEFEIVDKLLKKTAESTIYHTKEYVNLIAAYLQAKPFFLGIREEGRIIGIMPLVLKENKTMGNIINSNPYFGSYGGLIVHPDLPPMKKIETKRALLNFLADFATEHDCVLTTIITSPFDRDQTFYFDHLNFSYRDWRVAQVTLLPGCGGSVRESLFFGRFSSSCRRAIRKAEKLNITIEETREVGKALNEFYLIYQENMRAKGGLIRKREFFERVLELLPTGTCVLRCAKLDGNIIGGIFQFFYKNVIDYVQPAIDHDYRSSGATNLLVFHGMVEGVNKGYLYWNFGGTWKTQEKVYRFKRSFGAIDFVYHYFIIAHADHGHIKELTPAELRKEYPGFYVLPYSELRKK
jgi:hypothetical protein